jgi:hypothetical protein
VDDADVCPRCQAAVAEPAKTWRVPSDSSARGANPPRQFRIPSSQCREKTGLVAWVRKQRTQGCLHGSESSAWVLAQVAGAFWLHLHLPGDATFSWRGGHRHETAFPKWRVQLIVDYLTISLN